MKKMFTLFDKGMLIFFLVFFILFLGYWILVLFLYSFLNFKLNSLFLIITISIPLVIFISQIILQSLILEIEKISMINTLNTKLSLIKRDCIGVREELDRKGYSGFFIKDLYLKEFMFNIRSFTLKEPTSFFIDLSFIDDKIYLINDYLGQLRNKKGNKKLIFSTKDVISKELITRINDVAKNLENKFTYP